MNILLLGEYSSLYKNLQEGLIELGHDAVIASYGDSWKNVPRDIDLGGGRTDIISRIGRKIIPILNIDKLRGFDIVQYINPLYFYYPLLPNKLISNLIIEGNDKFFISAAGDDAYYWQKGRKTLRYGPFDDFLKYDIKKSDYFMNQKRCFEFNKWLVNRSNGIIPIMHEYEASYNGNANLKKTIPIPLNTDKIKYKENKLGDKIIIFHGLNRYGFKGTKYVEDAFQILSKKYPNDLELIIDGGLPLDEYLQLMGKVNVVIDQTSSYSLGVNGIYAMALGKVVLGGAEPESLASLGVVESPVINILPSAKDIVEKIEALLQDKKNISDIGYMSRKFAEKNHNYIDIAKKYLSVWDAN